MEKRNVEIKARLNDLDFAVRKVESLANGPVEILNQEDFFFFCTHERLKLRILENDFSTAQLIHYDRENVDGPKLCRYSYAHCPDGENLLQVLTNSLGRKGHVKKIRKLWLVGQTRVHIDQVNDLGSFIELEVVLREDQGVAEGEAIAHDLMRELRIANDDLINCSYIDMLLSKTS